MELEAHRATLPAWARPLAEGTEEDQMIHAVIVEELLILEHMARGGTMSLKASGRQMMGRWGWVPVLKDRQKFVRVMSDLGHALFTNEDVGNVKAKPWVRS